MYNISDYMGRLRNIFMDCKYSEMDESLAELETALADTEYMRLTHPYLLALRQWLVCARRALNDPSSSNQIEQKLIDIAWKADGKLDGWAQAQTLKISTIRFLYRQEAFEVVASLLERMLTCHRRIVLPHYDRFVEALADIICDKRVFVYLSGEAKQGIRKRLSQVVVPFLQGRLLRMLDTDGTDSL